jgi:glycosyltransferase involved in cell wall biosynthesis
MKRIVLSGVNLFTMGPIEVYREALQEVAESFGDNYEIVALVHRKSLFSVPGVLYVEFPKVRNSWLRRVKFEYFDLKTISRQLDADLWLSMHDVTPNVTARKRAVYCHNPSPFYSLRLRDVFFNWKFAAFVLFYGLLYRLNIKKNDAVIVQQDWMRSEFLQRYSLKNVIVAHVSIKAALAESDLQDSADSAQQVYRFFYPAYPRVFKNVEVILEAAELLEQAAIDGFEIWLTLDATTNRYARALVGKFRHLRSVKWLGVLDRTDVLRKYRQSDCLLFPSKLETWGLPITEFKETGRPMIVADLPYAHETVGAYDKVAFFNASDSRHLATIMEGAIQGQNVFSPAQARTISPPFTSNWRELWNLLLSMDAKSE